MNELELRIRVQGMIQEWVESFMANNGVSFTVMEDAFSKTLNYLKDGALREFIAAASVPPIPELEEEDTRKED